MATKRLRLPGPPPTGVSGSTPLTIEVPVEQPFLETREHARFVEFAEACSQYRPELTKRPSGTHKRTKLEHGYTKAQAGWAFRLFRERAGARPE